MTAMYADPIYMDGGDEIYPPEEGLPEDEDVRRLVVAQSQPRRAAISTEGRSNAEVKDFVKPVYPKSPESHHAIKDFMACHEKLQVLFGHMDARATEDIVNAFQELTVPQGVDIITQGEEGDCLYILAEGQVDVYVARVGVDPPGARGGLATSLGPGALFGELALMYSAPRAATVCVSSAYCKLWKLDRELFRMVNAQHGEQKYEMYEGWLAEIDLLKPLNHFELSRLSEMMESELFDAGEDIITQGEPGDKFYILEDGSCAAFIYGPDGEVKVMDYVNQGDYFGEIALLINEPRRATVRATGQGASLLSVSKEDFNAVLGPIQDRLLQHIDKYPQYIEFLQ